VVECWSNGFGLSSFIMVTFNYVIFASFAFFAVNFFSAVMIQIAPIDGRRPKTSFVSNSATGRFESSANICARLIASLA